MPAIRQATLDALGPSFAEDVARYVLPIFVDVDKAPVSVGTGFLMHTGRDHVLVTAAHVLDGLKSGTSYYFYATPTTKRTIAGEALIAKLPATGKRVDDVIDVAVVIPSGDEFELPPFPLVGKDSMPIGLVAAHATPRAEKRYAFLGLPSSRGKVDRIVKDVRSSATMNRLILAGSGLAELRKLLGFFGHRDSALALRLVHCFGARKRAP